MSIRAPRRRRSFKAMVDVRFAPPDIEAIPACHGPVTCPKCVAWSNHQTGTNHDRWIRRTMRIVGMRLHCIDRNGRPFKLASWAGSLPAAMRRFAAHARKITFLGT